MGKGTMIGVQRLIYNKDVQCGHKGCEKLAELTFSLDDEQYFVCEACLRAYAWPVGAPKEGRA